VRAAALLLVAVALAATGCGGDSRRDAVESYIQQVNRTQAQLRPAFRDAQAALGAFAAGRVTPATVASLQGGNATMRATRASLALLDPPPEARKLHADLLRLVDLQARLALELSLAADYVTKIGPAVQPAQVAAADLSRHLRAAKTGADQVAALREFAAAVDDSLLRVDALAPPPALLPWHDDQLARLGKSRRDALAIADGIEQRNARAVERALKAFTTSRPAAPARESEAAAVKAFNRRLREQEALLRRIAREQGDLVGI
jgi:hypothetical protein